MSDYYLLAAQVNHSNNDIKAVISCQPSDATAGCPKLITASRDYTLKAWMLGSEAFTRVDSVDSQVGDGTEAEIDSLAEVHTMTGHTDYLQCCAEDPSGTIVVSGANDKSLRVWSASTGSLIAIMVGHDAAAKCVAFFKDAGGRVLLVSGGWDNKCCVWDVFGSRRLLLDCFQHSQPVTCIAAFPASVGAAGDLVLSGSGDKRVVLWSPTNYGRAVMEFIGHTDTVQSVAVIDAGRFASGGNDGDILVWDVPSDAAGMMTMKTVRIPAARISAHESLVYTIAWDAEAKLLFSGSEDKTIKIWSNVGTVGRGSDVAPPKANQVILQPCLIWSIAVVKGARGPHIAAAGGDGFLRLWTTNREAIAPTAVMDAFDAAVTAAGGTSGAAGSNNPDIPDPSTLPTADELRTRVGPPTRDGQQQFVRGNAGEVELYTGQNGEWVHLGTVIANPDANGPAGGGAGAGAAATQENARAGGSRDAPPRKTQVHKGKMYDYLFPVSIGEAQNGQGGQQCVIPYNAGDSIYDAAQTFIYENSALGVSQGDKEQIVQHIISQLHRDDRDAITSPQSDFAREGAASQGNSNSQDAAAPAGEQRGHHEGSGPLLRVIYDAQDNIDGAVRNMKKKFAELELPELQSVNLQLEALQQGNHMTVDAAGRLLSDETGLFRRLGEGNRVPFFDLVRVATVRAPIVVSDAIVDLCVAGAVGPEVLSTSADASSGAAAASSSSSSSATASSPTGSPRFKERVMALRAVMHIVLLCPPHVGTGVFQRNPDIILGVRRNFLGPDSLPLGRATVCDFFTNCAVRFANAAELPDAEIERVPQLLQAVAAWMVWENDEQLLAKMVRIVGNLLLLSVSEVTKAVACSGSAELLGPEIDRLIGRWPSNPTLKQIKAVME